MLERGGFSFVALLVINPLAILLYQNCSFLPVTHGELASKELLTQKRAISSVATPERVDVNKLKTTNSNLADCKEDKENCPASGVE